MKKNFLRRLCFSRCCVMVSVTASFLTPEYTVLCPSKQKSQSSSERAILLTSKASLQHGWKSGWPFVSIHLSVCVLADLWHRRKSKPERERKRKLHSYLLVWRPHQEFRCTSSVAQYLYPDWIWGLRHKVGTTQLPAARCGPDSRSRQAQIQFCSTCYWVSRCTAWSANTGGMFPMELKPLRWSYFCCPTLSHRFHDHIWRHIWHQDKRQRL